MMKKYLSLLLALVLVLSMTVFAFAEENVAEEGNGSVNQNVTAEYEELEDINGGTVYYVTVAWEPQSGDLKYSAGETTYTWNGTKMQYEVQEGDAEVGKGWYGEATVKVTVTNKSNAGITATPSSNAQYGLDITSSVEKLELSSAAVKDDNTEIQFNDAVSVGTAQSDSITFTIKPGDDSTELTDAGTVGTVTVTIAPAEED